jgi:hypothetical protein
MITAWLEVVASGPRSLNRGLTPNCEANRPKHFGSLEEYDDCCQFDGEAGDAPLFRQRFERNDIEVMLVFARPTQGNPHISGRHSVRMTNIRDVNSLQVMPYRINRLDDFRLTKHGMTPASQIPSIVFSNIHSHANFF